VVDCCVVVRCLQWPLEDTIAGKNGSGWLNPRSSGARRSGRSTQKRAEAALSLIGSEQARAGQTEQRQSKGNWSGELVPRCGSGHCQARRHRTIQSEGFLLWQKVGVRRQEQAERGVLLLLCCWCCSCGCVGSWYAAVFRASMM
jgi:hypothetical protein